MRIATRVRLLGPALVLATAIPIAVVVYWGYAALLVAQRTDLLLAETEANASRLEMALGQISDDLRLLAGLMELDAFIAESLVSASGESSLAKEQIEVAFGSTLETRPHYSQLRLIGNDGLELIRVNGDAGRTTIVPDDALQNKAHRDYFQEAIALPPGSLYVSEVTLNREDGEIEVPHQPMLRVAVPLYSAPETAFGILLVNVRFDLLVELLFATVADYDLFIADDDGDFLSHPDSDLTFGFDLGTRHRIQDQHPNLGNLPGFPALPLQGAMATGNDESLLGIVRISPFRNDYERTLLLALGPRGEPISAATQVTAMNVALVTSLLLIAGALAAFLVASRIIRPVRELTAAANAMTSGKSADFAQIDRDDEVGELARALDNLLAALRANEQALIENNRDLEYFARIASHDLREPARRIAALANLLQMEPGGSGADDSQAMLRRIQAESLSMVEQLSELRVFSRLGQEQLERSDVALDELIGSVLASLKPELDQRSVEVIPPEPGQVSAYRTLLELVYRNLVLNSLHHVAEDGFTVEFTREHANGPVVLGVRNTGSAISGDPARLFEPFYSESDESVRTGLGLSICKRIIERHGGKIWAESANGTVHFRFTLEGAES